jgi:hypothetical protein
MKVNTTFLHVPVGLVTVALICANTGLGVLFGAGFIAYEITQGGDPHLDIKGFLWGLGTAGVLLLILSEVL